MLKVKVIFPSVFIILGPIGRGNFDIYTEKNISLVPQLSWGKLIFGSKQNKYILHFIYVFLSQMHTFIYMFTHAYICGHARVWQVDGVAFLTAAPCLFLKTRIDHCFCGVQWTCTFQRNAADFLSFVPALLLQWVQGRSVECYEYDWRTHGAQVVLRGVNCHLIHWFQSGGFSYSTCVMFCAGEKIAKVAGICVKVYLFAQILM